MGNKNYKYIPWQKHVIIKDIFSWNVFVVKDSHSIYNKFIIHWGYILEMKLFC